MLVDAGTGRVHDVVAAASLGERDDVARERLTGRALLPGFVNAHSHSFQRLIRGRTQWRPARAAGADFWSWRQAMYDAALRLTPEQIHDVARACFIEMLCAGYTTVGEFHYLQRDGAGKAYADPNELAQRVIAAAASVGIRICLLNVCYATGGIDVPLAPEQRRFATPDLDAFLRSSEALLTSVRAHATVRAGIAPHSVRAVPRGWLRPLGAWAAEQDVPLHMHVSEQPAEIAACIAAHALRPVELLAREDVIGAGFTAVHATHISADEIALLGGAGATVCVCPTTERDLGDGILPATELDGAGATLAIGSDSQTIIAPLEELRLIEYHERLRTLKRVALCEPADAGAACASAPALLRMGAAHGARSLGVAGGALRAGAVADLVAIDLDHAAIAGWNDDALAALLVFCAPADIVTDVWVAGRQVVSDRAHPLAAECVAALRRALPA